MIHSWIVPILIGVILSQIIVNYVFIFAEIPSGSMENTLQVGDRVIVNRIEYKRNGLNRFDVVVFKHKMQESDTNATVLIKRVIGLPGDIVEIKNGQLYINDEIQYETYLKDTKNIDSEQNFGPVIVPENCYFMMGDNRSGSFDSRYWDYMFVSESEIWGICNYKVYPQIKRI